MIKPPDQTQEYSAIGVAFASSMGFSINEALARGLINRKAANFLVNRTGELFDVMARGGVLTRDERGIYFEDNRPKEPDGDEQ